MKHYFLGLTSLLVVSIYCSYNLWFKTEEQIVYIDINILLADYKGMENAQKEFGKKRKVWQANVDSLIVNFQEELKTYEKSRSKMSKKENELKQELLKNKQQQLGNYQEAISKQSTEEENRLTLEVIDQINAFIKNYGENHHYKIILGANSSGNLLYAKEGIDITKDVLDQLNAAYVKG